MVMRKRDLIDVNGKTEDFYNNIVVDELLEDDELGANEEAFMRGYIA